MPGLPTRYVRGVEPDGIGLGVWIAGSPDGALAGCTFGTLMVRGTPGGGLGPALGIAIGGKSPRMVESPIE